MTFDVLLGGTFGPLHDGHRKLLRTAADHGDVLVGVTSDDLAQQTRDESRPIPPAEERQANVERVLEQCECDFSIFELDDPVGPAIEREDVTKIVVSPEPKTHKRVEQINQERQEQGRDPLEMIVADPVYAEDGERISSTRIVKGEIDEHGNLLEE